MRAEEKVSPEIREVIEAPRFKHAHWGILVADRGTGEVIYELNADKLFAPASTTKLYSVSTALDALGADYCFETPIYRRGTVDAEGTLEGDLILVASGDLTLGGRTTSTNEIEFTKADHTYATDSGGGELTLADPLAGLNALAKQVAEAGIKRVRGDVLIDARLFDAAFSSGSGPGRVTPIMVNDNLIDWTVTATSVGSPAKIEWRPQSAAIEVDAWVETIAAGGDTKIERRQEGEGRFIVRGKIAADRTPLVCADEVANPTNWSRALLIEALERAGVKMFASIHDANSTGSLPKQGDYLGLDRVAVLKSPPFSENVRLALKVSHNLHSSTLPLLAAVRNGTRRLEDGMHLEHDFLKRAGIDVESISFASGAGGARADFTTPRTNVALLRYLATRSDFPVFERGLPILGVDGTLAEVSVDSPARGKVRAKTGTYYLENLLNDRFVLTSKALAGYMTSQTGRELTISFVVNCVPLDSRDQRREIGQTLGKLCEIVYQAH